MIFQNRFHIASPQNQAPHVHTVPHTVDKSAFLNRHETAEILKVGMTKFLTMVRYGIFPRGKRIALNDRRVYWHRETVLSLKSNFDQTMTSKK